MVKKVFTFVNKFSYGFLFVVLLPLFLIFWANRLESMIIWPVPKLGPVGVISTLLGLILIIKGMLDLIIIGKGFPMNAYPPKYFVTRGIYSWFSHPIYLGSAFLSFGLSLIFDSSAGLYIVTPIFILMMLSLVYGYERLAIKKLFGDQPGRYRPVFSMPDFSNIYRIAWSPFRNFAEYIANSRHDRIFLKGKFRIINHGIYSGLAGAVGIGIFAFITKNNLAGLIILLCVLIGGALFAQLRWGSGSLLRPFGYWGGILGGIIGIIIVQSLFDIPLYLILIAGMLCAPFTQAAGRLRCLSQGCCHGIVTTEDFGIRVWQSQSRVVVLSEMKGVYIHATQLYSILFNLILGFLLFWIWLSGDFNGSMVVGMYFMLTGIERFAEDAYRGEKQTKMLGGLQENQWIAIMALIIGIFITMLHFPPMTVSFGMLDWAFLITVLSGGLIAAFAMSMDFPKSNIRYSRLSG